MTEGTDGLRSLLEGHLTCRKGKKPARRTPDLQKRAKSLLEGHLNLQKRASMSRCFPHLHSKKIFLYFPRKKKKKKGRGFLSITHQSSTPVISMYNIYFICQLCLSLHTKKDKNL